MSCEVIAITNQKGGVGKSTTANAIGAGLHAKGYKVLFIDLDAQGSLSYCCNVYGATPTSLDVLIGKATIKEAVKETPQGDIIPASVYLSNYEGNVTDLKKALSPILKQYDYIIIDTPPALGKVTLNALTASNSIIVPVQADIFSLQGLAQLTQTVNFVKSKTNKGLFIKGLVLTRYNGRAVLSKELAAMLEETANKIGTKIYNAKIRECMAIKEALAYKQDIFTYSPKSNGSLDYTGLVDEIIKER